MSTTHEPVLLDAVMQYLDPKEGDRYLDLTAGYGGHASHIIGKTQAPKRATLVDRDRNAIAVLQTKFASQGVTIMHTDFATVSEQLLRQNQTFDLILADIGVSSPHLNDAHRGFSLQREGPLDMRMDEEQQLTADHIINSYDEDSLAKILKTYGEEPRATQIARAIIAARPLKSTTELAAIVARQWPGRSRVHPATRTFQALRIAVNNELEQLERSVPSWIRLLAPGGRLVIISFHSLEDRIIKQALQRSGGNRYDASIQILTKRPVVASAHELVSNPRARSAKLRAAVKIKNNTERRD